MLRHAFRAISLLTILAGVADATSVVVVATPTTIALGADAQQTTFSTDRGTTSRKGQKIALLHNRIAVATIGVHSGPAGIRNGEIVSYDFDEWIKRVEAHTSANVSVTQLASFIKDEADSTFQDFSIFIKKGAFPRGHSGDYLVEYVVAGFEQGVPIIFWIHLKIDWHKKDLLPASENPIRPEFGKQIKSGHGEFGMHRLIDAVFARQGASHEKANARAPLELAKLVERKNLTSKQASKIVCTLCAR